MFPALPARPTRPTHPVLVALLATVLGLTLGLSPAAAPPAHAETAPEASEVERPSVEEEAPSVEEESQPVDDVSPSVEDASPSAEEEAPWVEDASPSAEEEAPSADDELPEATDDSPFRAQPQSVTVPEGEPIVLRTTVVSPYDGAVTWDVSTDGGTTWRPSTAPGAEAAAGAAIQVTLTLNELSGANANRDGEHRRAVLTYVDDLGETQVEYSDTATITVTPRTPTVSEQPRDVQVVVGQPVTFSVSATGSTFPSAVQWQRASGPDGPWQYLTGHQDSTLDLGAAAMSMDDTWYRASLDNGSGQQVWSAPAQLRVAYAMPDATGQAAPGRSTELVVFDPDRVHGGVMEVLAPAGTRITAMRTNSAADLAFAISEDGRSAVSDRAATWGQGTTQVFVTLTVDEDQQPEAVLDDGVARVMRTDGSVLAQAGLSVTVLGIAPEITVQPGTRHAVHGQDVTLHAEATGLPAPTVHWESSRDGVDWTPLPGETTTTLTLEHVTTAMDGTLYRAVFTNLAAPDGIPSDTATLHVRPVRPAHLTLTPRVQVVNRLPA